MRTVTLAPKRPLVPGFPVTLTSNCLVGTGKKRRHLNTLRFELGVVRALRGGTVTRKNIHQVSLCFSRDRPPAAFQQSVRFAEEVVQ